jgi:hypothetical protein
MFHVITLLLAFIGFFITNSLNASEDEFYNYLRAPLPVEKGKLYSFEKLDRQKLIQASSAFKKKKKEAKKKKSSKGSSLASNESYVCNMLKTVTCDVLKNDKNNGVNLKIIEICKQPLYGEAKIAGDKIIYKSTGKKSVIDTFYYKVHDEKTGLEGKARVRILVHNDIFNGDFVTGNDSAVFEPTGRHKFKQMRNPYKYFTVSVKPVIKILKGDVPTKDMARIFSKKVNSEKGEALPAGYIWNYPYYKYFKKGSPVMTVALGFTDLRIDSKYIKKYIFSFDIESHTLSSKNHWRGFSKFGTGGGHERSAWTGDVGFSLEDKDFDPVSIVNTKKNWSGYYKLTTYQGITGFFADRRSENDVKSNAPWSVIRVRIPLDTENNDGHLKSSFDFWPFLQFMIDEKGWKPGSPLGGPIGNEIYSNADLSNKDSRPAGETVIHSISHWVKTDLPLKNGGKPITLKIKDGVQTIQLGSLFSLPGMRGNPRYAPESFKWPALKPKYKLLKMKNLRANRCVLKGGELRISPKSPGTFKLLIKCYDSFHEWYDDKIFTIIVK